MGMMKTNLVRVAGISLFVFVFLAVANLYARNDHMPDAYASHKQNAQKWTTQLSQKVKLTMDQQTKIEKILINYQNAEAKTNVKNYGHLQAAYNRRIESVLNDNQKKLYNSYSSQWWKEISKPAVESVKQNKY
jgi:Spy/CpxP family protein refolding chaperone